MSLGYGEHRVVKCRGIEFKVTNTGGHTHSPRGVDVPGSIKTRNGSGPYVITHNGKYLARVHPAQVKAWCRHFAFEMVTADDRPPAKPPTVAFYRIRIMYNRDGLWLFDGVDGTVAKAGDAKPYTRVQADARIKAMSHGYRGERRLEAVPVYQ